MKKLFDNTRRKTLWILLVVALIAVPFIATRCGTGATTGNGTGTITIKGLADTTTLAEGVKAMGALADADVTIGTPGKDTEALTTIATGTTASDGTYSITVSVSDLQSITDDNNRACNLMVTVGTSLGATVSFDTATQAAFVPVANKINYMKQQIALKTFGKGIDPTELDYNGDIERKFSDLTGYGPTDADRFAKMADAIKASEDVMAEIAAGLGISTADLALLDAKAREYHDTYLEPIFRAAFEAKAPPDQDALDAAFANMEQAMKDYALSLGLTEQQFMDLKNMCDQQMRAKMESGLGPTDPAVVEIKHRDMGNKMIDLFYAQYDAAYTLANATTPEGDSFAEANPTRFSAYVSSKEAIATVLREKLNDTDILDPKLIGNYLRTAFFDAYLFPPKDEMITQEVTPDEMNDIMASWESSRIMVYFMGFFSDTQRDDIFSGMGETLQPIFRNRFEDITNSSGYYMGHEFWASEPSADEIQSRLENFKTALDNAINSIVKTPFESVFGVSDTTTSYINAFRILNAPPDAF